MVAAKTWRILQPDGHALRERGDAVAPFPVPVRIENGADWAAYRHGMLPLDKVRSIDVTGFVDVSRHRVAIPQWIVDRLELLPRENGTAPFVDQYQRPIPAVTQVCLTVMGRTSTGEALVPPNAPDIIIGAFVLEVLDLLVDPFNSHLIPRDPNMTLTEIE